jgi:hypothetical protein
VSLALRRILANPGLDGIRLPEAAA